ncbi:uncharacterized protein LACBIDRAFT_295225 [Laccaria bicolor S238N-H82]|uniref:Predicted protein n=1 Tax=Laccaria bicolor (strain S238N-H82 / ATCC MYA-4686) TaxID=486041 RepID=B0DPK3_LACBS|nr:uncharacterized protein LACBIDRAFT_295225 [Laccaria bicolor S238N-H82]EDR03467.1 predicted protein [Laccaria bicolor S238N-H82]|eukprot:XP_001885923.1 predicted protein [Laccaria bicolor S238N-H82]
MASSTDSPPPYGSTDGSESDPLIPPSGRSHNKNGISRTTLMIIIFIIGGLVGAFIQCAASQSIFSPAVRDSIRRQWDSERQGWERERRQREEARKRAQIHWLALESSQRCERYGTRKYWAKLGPLVGDYDPMEACWTSEIEIHGWKMKPTYCEDKGADHGAYGHWIVDFDEGGCRPFWDRFTDKGCTAPGSGLRRFDAHLINLDYADGWNVMCSSTPADFNGLHFNGPMSCVNHLLAGVFGTWHVVDGGCL